MTSVEVSPILNGSNISQSSSRKSKNVALIEDFEQTDLYRLIHETTEESWIASLNIVCGMTKTKLCQKSSLTGNTFFHEIILCLSYLHRNNNGNIQVAVVLIYRLALYGADINSQNLLGNTSLHVACFRPMGELVMIHLLRLGADPCLENNAGYRVFVDLNSFSCYLIKGQADAYCSIWQAVSKEDFELIEKLLKCWFRVNTKRKRKTLTDVAYDTGNYKIVDKLIQYQNTNEMVMSCYASALDKANEFLKMKFEKPDINTTDHSSIIHKPLLEAIQELSPLTDQIVNILQNAPGIKDTKFYKDSFNLHVNSYTDCTFYNLIEDLNESSLLSAWKLIEDGQLPINAVSVDGDSFLHLIVHKYCTCEDIILKRYLVRILYRLVLAGVDVNHRNESGETILVSASRMKADRRFLDCLINLGVDSSLRCKKGKCVSVNTYVTRGDLILTQQTQRKHLPGLWPAVEDNDVDRVKYWLSSLCRVNTERAGRNLLQYAKDNNYMEVANLLEKDLYLTEFVVASLAADVKRMKHCLAMGQGTSKVNAIYKHYFAGLTDDWKVEFVPRPLLASVMEYSSADVTLEFIKYGVNLNVQYEEEAPCAPIAFWAFRDDINDEITKIIAQHADLGLRDELGSTLLHRAITRKGDLQKKKEILSILLERRANVAARDLNKYTPRDYCEFENVENGPILLKMIDDHVLNTVYEENYDAIEELIIQGYDHITDICGTARNKTAIELAQLKYSKELVDLLQNVERYQFEIRQLHAAVITNTAQIYTKFLSEKKLAWGVDSRDRNILHLAVLYRHAELVGLICDQFPQLIAGSDCLQRTPIHYAVSLRDQRQILSIISSTNSVNLQNKDSNNLSALDYIAELESPTLPKLKTRGRRMYNYDVRHLVAIEKDAAETEMISLNEDKIAGVS